MRSRRAHLISIGLALLAVVAGCATSPRPALAHRPPAKRAAAPVTPDATIVFLPGIMGRRPFDDAFVIAMLRERVARDAQHLDWTAGRNMFEVLRQEPLNRELAGHVADELRALRRERPNTRILLVGHSGGAGMAVWALEALRADETGVVDDLVLLAPALSPEYDLSRALSRVRGGAISAGTPLDAIILGGGTWMYGTLDRVRGPAAGWKGFAMPAGADAPQYAKLRQVTVRYRPLRSWVLGAHLNALSPPFVRGELAPMLRAPAATPAPAR